MEDDVKPLAGVKKVAIAAVICALGGNVCSMRSSSSSTETINGVGRETITLGTDYGHILMAVVAILLVLVGLVQLSSAGRFATEDPSLLASVQKQKRIYVAVFLGVVALAVWLFYAALPSTTVIPIG